MTNPPNHLLSQTEKELVNSILTKIESEKTKKGFRIISFDNLFKLLNATEQKFIKKLLKINLLEYGFKGKFYGIQEISSDLVEIADQQYKKHDDIKTIEIQYLKKFFWLIKNSIRLFLGEKRNNCLFYLDIDHRPIKYLFFCGIYDFTNLISQKLLNVLPYQDTVNMVFQKDRQLIL